VSLTHPPTRLSTVQDNTLTGSFTRRLNTNQPQQDYTISLTSPMVVIWAVSPTRSITDPVELRSAFPPNLLLTYSPPYSVRSVFQAQVPEHGIGMSPPTYGTASINFGAPSTCAPPAPSAGSYRSAAGDFSALWTLSLDRSSITITFSARTTGWVSLGIGTSPFMASNFDCVVAWVGSSSTTLLDLYSRDYSQPGK
jgi:hypothetical protein